MSSDLYEILYLFSGLYFRLFNVFTFVVGSTPEHTDIAKKGENSIKASVFRCLCVFINICSNIHKVFIKTDFRQLSTYFAVLLALGPR